MCNILGLLRHRQGHPLAGTQRGRRAGEGGTGWKTFQTLPAQPEPASPGCPLVRCERMRRTHQGAMAAAHACPTAGSLWRVQAETLLSPNPAAEAAAAGVTFSCCIGPCSKDSFQDG